MRNIIWHNELTLFSNQVERNPGFARARFNLGLAFKAKGDFKKALEMFKYAIPLNPKMSYAYVNIGNIYFDNNDTENAFHYYLKALELNPSDGYLRNNLGVNYAMKGKRQEALNEFRESMKLNPEYISPYINLGNLFATEGNYAKALLYLDKAVNMDRSDTNKALIARASVLIKKGRLQDAEKDLDYASNKFANKSVFLKDLANAFYKAGKYADSLRAYRKAQISNSKDTSINKK